MRSTILLLIDGFGLSSSWQGNPIATAKPENFYHLWQNFYHKALNVTGANNSEIGFKTNPEINHAVISHGKFVQPLYDNINKAINNDEYSGHTDLLKAFDRTKSYFSAVHFIFTLSPDNSYGDLNHLFALLNIASQANVNRAYLHLIVKSSKDQLKQTLKLIENIESKILSLGNVEIASLVGFNYFVSSQRNSQLKAAEAIVHGKGRQVLSPVQALTINSDYLLAPDDLPPTIVTKNHQPIGNISDFDLVVFSDYFIEHLALITSALVKNINLINNPPQMLGLVFLNDSLSYKLSREENSNITYLNHHKFNQSLISYLSECGIKSSILAESDRIPHYKQYFLPSGSSSVKEYYHPLLPGSNWYRNNYSYILEELYDGTRSMMSYDNQFILTEFSTLDHLAKESDFSEIVKAVLLVDKKIGLLAKHALETESTLIITSNWGKIEEIRGLLTPINSRPSLNPVPYVYINRNSFNHKSTSGTNGIPVFDLMNIKHSLIDIAPTVLKSLKLEIPDEMKGMPLMPD